MMKTKIPALIFLLSLTMILCTVGVFASDMTIITTEPTNAGLLSQGQLLIGDRNTEDKNTVQILSENDDADDEETYQTIRVEGRVYYSGDEETYDHAAHDEDIYNAIRNHEASLDVSGWTGITVDNYGSIVAYVVNMHPEFFDYDKTSCSYYISGSVNVIQKINFYYTDYDDSQYTAFDNALEAAKTELNAQITVQMTPLEKALVVHDFLDATVIYDYTNLSAGTLSKTVYNMYGVLVEHKAVCQGYAETFLYFMNYYGVPCGLATSKTANHAWNVIRIGDNWYHIDVTWDDPTWDIYGRVCHDYFLLSRDSLINGNTSSGGNVKGSSDKSDFVTQVSYDQTYADTADTSYETGTFWHNINARMYHSANTGLWYYLGNGTLNSYRYADKVTTSLVTGIDDIWYVWGSGSSYWQTDYSRMYGTGNLVYYSTPTAIYVYNINSKANHVYYTPDISEGYIYGFSCVDGVMGYTLEQSPNLSADETVLVIGASNADASVHVWDTGTLTSAATCTEDGVRTYVCTVCGTSKTETVTATGHTHSIHWNWMTTSSDTGWRATCTDHCSVCGVIMEHTSANVEKSEGTTEDIYTATATVNGAEQSSTRTVTKTYTVTVDGACVYTDCAYGQIVTVTSPDTVDWYLTVSGNPVSVAKSSKTYTLAVTGDMVITTGEASEEAPTLTFFATERAALDDGGSRIVYTVQWTVPSSCTFVKAGVMRDYSDEDAALTLDQLTRNSSSSLTTRNGTYRLGVNISDAKDAMSVSAAGYLIYEDADGVSHTIYSDINYQAGMN